MTNIVDKIKDTGIERSVLSGILINGSDTLLDIQDIIESNAFSSTVNRKIFDILKYLVNEKNIKKFDITTILSVSKSIVSNKITDNNKDYEYLETLFSSGPSHENTLILSSVLYKLSLARQGIECLRETALELSNIKGEEPIDKIISKVEDPIFDFTGKIVSSNCEMQQIGQDFAQIMEQKEKNEGGSVGLSTCFPRWDESIGGGLMRSTISVIGARQKVGKSFIALNIAYSVAKRNIPVLYLDTELTREIQLDRLTSIISKVDLEKIRHGTFSGIDEERNAVLSCENTIKSIPLMHESIIGQSIQSITSICRRWISKQVGFDEYGKANPCLIVYDYIKLMDPQDLKKLQEYQMLGFLMTALHNFTVRWSVPMLATTQINRDGIEQEGGHIIAGSDRILALCSNFTILKNKLPEELADDPPNNGTMKLVVTDTRFGPGMNRGEYINMKNNLYYATFEEGLRSIEQAQQAFENNEQVE